MSADDITVILHRVQRGEEQPADRLLPLVYDELRRLAAARMAHEPAGLTLQPTALVHEAWLRLGGDHQPDWKNRAQFFAAAAEAMRRILIDRARSRAAVRHGGGQCKISSDELDLGGATDDDRILMVSEALEKFAEEDPAKAEVVKLRFFGGLTLAEAAQAVGTSERTAKRWWMFARARLYQILSAN